MRTNITTKEIAQLIDLCGRVQDTAVNIGVSIPTLHNWKKGIGTPSILVLGMLQDLALDNVNMKRSEHEEGLKFLKSLER